MSKSITGEKKYKPRLLCFGIIPGLEPEFYDSMLERNVNVIIIGATVPSGGVPNKGEYSFIPFIKKAVDLGIPVYLVRGSVTAKKNIEDGWSEDYFKRDMSSLYEPEADAIIAGAIPLEKPDSSLLGEILKEITEVYSKKPDYEKGINQISNKFSSPEFIEQIKRIREHKN